MKGERLIRASVLGAFVVAIAGVCPGRSYAQEAVLTDNSTVVAAKPKSVPSAALQRSLHVVGPLDARVECDALLKFDLSTLPAGTASTNILKATLILWVNTLTHSGTFDIVSVGGAWNERTVTWATAPALIQVEAAGLVPVQDQFVAVDLTELVKNWVDGTITNNGIAIVPNTSSINVLFDSKENTETSHQPRLLLATSQNVSLFPNDVGYVTATVTNAVAQTNGTYSAMSAGTATFASNSASLGDLSTSGWSNFVNSVTNGLPDANALAGKAATNQNVSVFPNDAGYVTQAVTNGLETITAANALASTNTAASALTNATFTLGANFTNGNFRCFYTVSVSMVSTTVVDFINLTDATTNTISIADVGGLILTNSVFQFAGPNEVFIINTNRSGAGQAPSLVSVTGKIL